MSTSLKYKMKVMQSGAVLRIICPLGVETDMWCDVEREKLVCWGSDGVGNTCDHLYDFPEDVIILWVVNQDD